MFVDRLRLPPSHPHFTDLIHDSVYDNLQKRQAARETVVGLSACPEFLKEMKKYFTPAAQRENYDARGGPILELRRRTLPDAAI